MLFVRFSGVERHDNCDAYLNNIYNMTTVINTPANGESTTFGFMIGVVLTVTIVLGLFFVYALPFIKKDTGREVNVNLQIPTKSPQQ